MNPFAAFLSLFSEPGAVRDQVRRMYADPDFSDFQANLREDFHAGDAVSPRPIASYSIRAIVTLLPGAVLSVAVSANETPLGAFFWDGRNQTGRYAPPPYARATTARLTAYARALRELAAYDALGRQTAGHDGQDVSDRAYTAHQVRMMDADFSANFDRKARLDAARDALRKRPGLCSGRQELGPYLHAACEVSESEGALDLRLFFYGEHIGTLALYPGPYQFSSPQNAQPYGRRYARAGEIVDAFANHVLLKRAA